MSKVFYDKLVALEKVQKEIKKIATTKEEREDLERIVDEYIHHRMLESILDKLPNEHHEQFLTQFSEAPHHDGLWDYLKTKTNEDMETHIKVEIVSIESELLEVIKPKSSK